MLAACMSKYKLTSISVETHDQPLEMEIENTSGVYLLGTCGDSTSCFEGEKAKNVDGHGLNCWSI